MSIVLSDSRCTQDLHAAVNDLKKIAGGATIGSRSNNKEMFLHLATLAESVERVSRRIDGERAERIELHELCARLVDEMLAQLDNPNEVVFRRRLVDVANALSNLGARSVRQT